MADGRGSTRSKWHGQSCPVYDSGADTGDGPSPKDRSNLPPASSTTSSISGWDLTIASLLARMAVATAVLTGRAHRVPATGVPGALTRELASSRLRKSDRVRTIWCPPRCVAESRADARRRKGRPVSGRAPSVIVRGWASNEAGYRPHGGLQIAGSAGRRRRLGSHRRPRNTVVNGKTPPTNSTWRPAARRPRLGGSPIQLWLPTMQDTPRDATLANPVATSARRSPPAPAASRSPCPLARVAGCLAVHLAAAAGACARLTAWSLTSPAPGQGRPARPVQRRFGTTPPDPWQEAIRRTDSAAAFRLA